MSRKKQNAFLDALYEEIKRFRTMPEESGGVCAGILTVRETKFMDAIAAHSDRIFERGGNAQKGGECD